MTAMNQVIRPWSKDKLEILGKYLHAYSKIMRSQKRKGWLHSYTYVDAFSFAGRYKDPDVKAYADGSPLVALKCEIAFDKYIFIELSRRRLRALERLVRREFPNQYAHAEFKCGDANFLLRDEIAPRFASAKNERGFVFLDPYGLQVEFSTIDALSKTKALDVFVNFSIMGIIRNLERKRLPDDKAIHLLERVMGDSKLVGDIYVTQRSFLDNDRTYRASLRAGQVAYRYIERIGPLFPFVSKPVLMRNSTNTALYVLFLASHNQTAVKITNDILSRYEIL